MGPVCVRSMSTQDSLFTLEEFTPGKLRGFELHPPEIHVKVLTSSTPEHNHIRK